jgi:hypothetical protein
LDCRGRREVLSSDLSYPTPPADKRNLEAQARYLSELISFIFKLPLSEATIHALRRYFARVGPENSEDLVAAILLECWEAHRSETTLTEQELIRAADRVRQRLIRETKRTVLTGTPEVTPSHDLPPEEEVSFVLREFQSILERSSPEEALLFQRYYLDGQRDIRALSEELHMSPATVYRRLSQIRANFLSRREALEPPHWAD